jgi:hypothetical protein
MKKNYLFLILCFVILVSAVSSCDLFQPGTPIPGYIHIEKIDVTTNYSVEGTNSSKVSDAWVYVDEQLLGCFELPATFPVIAEGVHAIKIRPGIKVDGIGANRSPYPFYTQFNQQVDIEPGKKVTLSPTVNYQPTTHFDLLQDFEAAGVLFDSTANSDSNIDTIAYPAANVFQGGVSGIITATPSRPFVEIATVNQYVLPKGGAPVFLEFNYKCNHQFTISIYAWGTVSVQQFTVLNINPSQNWNKAYIYLTPNVSAASSATGYQVALGMLNTSSDSAYVLLDNIKLIH